MTEAAVVSVVSGGIMTITLNRPEKSNAWNGPMARGYFGLLEQAAYADDARAAVDQPEDGLVTAHRGSLEQLEVDVAEFALGLRQGSQPNDGILELVRGFARDRLAVATDAVKIATANELLGIGLACRDRTGVNSLFHFAGANPRIVEAFGAIEMTRAIVIEVGAVVAARGITLPPTPHAAHRSTARR